MASRKNKYSVIKTIIFVVLLSVIGASIFYLTKPKGFAPSWMRTQYTYFYGESCPHCANVDQFLKDKGLDKSLKMTRKEVYYNDFNAKDLAEQATDCDIETDQLGIPLLWDGRDCIIGDQPIIDYFREKM